jgi:hypothetical protein
VYAHFSGKGGHGLGTRLGVFDPPSGKVVPSADYTRLRGL